MKIICSTKPEHLCCIIRFHLNQKASSHHRFIHRGMQSQNGKLQESREYHSFALHKTTCFKLKIFPLQAPNGSFPCPSFQQHMPPSWPGKEHSLRRHQHIHHPSRRSGNRHLPWWRCHTGKDARCHSHIHPQCPQVAWSHTASWIGELLHRTTYPEEETRM